MTAGTEGEWVRQGTPRDDNADWNQEQSEYGTALSPTQWDDYSSEQPVPVSAPRGQSDDGVATAASPATASERDAEPVPGQEPDSEEEYRSDETGGSTEDDPAGDADDSGMDPVHIDPPEQRGASAVMGEPDSDEDTAETTRPRPIVPDASMAAVGAMEPAGETQDPTQEIEMGGGEGSDDGFDESGERDVEATQYLAVDPVPAELTPDEPANDNTESLDSGSRDEDRGDDGTPASVHAADSEFEGDPVTDDSPEHNGDEDDMEATQAVPVADGSVDPATTGPVPDDLYRTEGAEPTAVIAEGAYPDVDVEEERQQARLDAERQAREQRLGAVATSPENASRDDAAASRITTDKLFPSFSLFVLRLVTASILGAISWQILGSGVDATANYLAGFPLIPEPRLVAWILGFTLGALALLLVIGLLQRIVGLLLLVVAAATLAFIRWGTNFSIFSPGIEGFVGDRDLLLAAVGLLLLGMGGGRWGIDGAFRASRAASKAEREG